MQGLLHLLNMAGNALAHLEQENARLKARVAELETARISTTDPVNGEGCRRRVTSGPAAQGATR